MLLAYFLLPRAGGSQSSEEGAALPNRRHFHPALEVVSAHLRMLRAASADPQGFARGANPGSAAHPAGPAPAALQSGTGTGTAKPAGGWRLVPAGAARGAGQALQPLLGRARPRRAAAPRAGPAAPASRGGAGAVEAPLPQPFNGRAAPSARGFRPPAAAAREGGAGSTPARAAGSRLCRWPPPKRRTSRQDKHGTGLPDPSCPLALTSPHPAPRTARHDPSSRRLFLRSRGRPRSRPHPELRLPGGWRGCSRPSAAVHAGGQGSAGRAQAGDPPAQPRLPASPARGGLRAASLHSPRHRLAREPGHSPLFTDTERLSGRRPWSRAAPGSCRSRNHTLGVGEKNTEARGEKKRKRKK